ncbi:MAG: 4Fe-4S binding protein, partial [Desulfatiglandales bacterium]
MKLGSHSQHFVEIDHVKCNGCVLCLKACPMKAIRVLKDGKAHILGTCIDCGSCISVCPRGAISPKTSASLDEIKRKYTIVTVSPVLYTQFGEET